MTLDERLILARAGYTAQEIAGFEAPPAPAPADPQAQAPAPAPAPAPEPAPAPAPAPASAPAPAPVHAENAPAWAVALKQSIDTLTRVQQAHNVKYDDMGTPASVEDMALDALHNYVNGGSEK